MCPEQQTDKQARKRESGSSVGWFCVRSRNRGLQARTHAECLEEVLSQRTRAIGTPGSDASRMSQGRPRRPSSVEDDIEDVDSWRCTDVLFLAIFSLFWAGLVIISLGAFATGDLTALEFGTDYLGNRCGQGKFADRPVVWYPRMSEDLGSQWMIMKEHPSALVMYGLCLPECPRRPAAPIADYGYAEGHTGAKAAYWPVAMRARSSEASTPRVAHWPLGLNPRSGYCLQGLVASVWRSSRPMKTPCVPSIRVVPRSTYNAINHCLPQVETNATTRSYCEFPSCDKAGEKCQRVVGVPHSVWEMSTREQFSKCSRQIDVCAPYAQTCGLRWARARASSLGRRYSLGLALGHCSRAHDSGLSDQPDQPRSMRTQIPADLRQAAKHRPHH